MQVSTGRLGRQECRPHRSLEVIEHRVGKLIAQRVPSEVPEMARRQAINVRSPLRVDFVGMTDYVPACKAFGGSIINATINKYIYATLTQRYDKKIVLHAPDQNDKRVEVENHGALDGQGELGLAQEIIRRFKFKHGIELTTYSEMPAGAGLGSSSTIATCLIAALDAMTGCRMTAHEMAEMARDCETVALGVTYGWQDQYSPVTGGGVKFMKYWPESLGWHVEVDRIAMTAAHLAELEKSMVVCYSGISRPAKAILDAVAEGVEEGKREVVEALKGMSRCAEEIRLRLLAGEVNEIGLLLTEAWELHQRLHPEVTNERIEELYRIAIKAGAAGGRVCGAGGGGALLFMAAPNKEYAVRTALRDANARIFDCSVDQQGLLIW
jgi:D-glycero-alpha-D-manno-heptose-7-phosphate kinase